MCAPSHKKRGTIRGMPSPPEAGKAKTFKKGPAFRRRSRKTPTLLDRSLDHFFTNFLLTMEFRMTCDIILGRTRRVRERHEAARIGARQGEPDAGCGARRPDGYHEVVSVMQSVALYDTVTMESGTGEASPDLRRCGDPPPTGAIWRGGRRRCSFAPQAWPAMACILPWKRVSPQAGLGGGSSDAAAVLRGPAEAVRPGAAHGGAGTYGHGVGQ